MITEASPFVAEVSDVRVRFERRGRFVHALRGVSLGIRPGEILGLVGESGSGKTVLGLSILGLLSGDPEPSVEGSVTVLGTNMLTASAEERRVLRRNRLGAVFQDPATSLNPTMKIGRQIIEAAGSSDEAIRLLEAVGVPDPQRRLHAYPHQLSGGQQQRVMIAMAIAGDPSLVIADEPTTALDVTVQSQILKLIRRLRDDLGCSFLLVTHDLGVAAEIADRVVVLYAGRVLEEGETTQVLERPAHPYTIGLLQSRLNMRSRRDCPLIALPGEVPDPRSPPPGCPFSPRCQLRIDECDRTVPDPTPTEDGGLSACIRQDEARRFVQQIEEREPWRSINAARDHVMRVQGLRKHFVIRKGLHRNQELQALRGVDLEITKGESVVLVGESGSGKTTLLRVVAGLERADAGVVELTDEARPQMIFQDALASLTPWLKIGEILRERLRHVDLPRSQAAGRVTDALRKVGLRADIAFAKPRQLSGGQAQRVAIARAIVEPPGILLADEPTSSLDVSLRAVVLNLLGKLRRELDLTLLFVTHDLAAARVIADRIAVMYLGEIVEIGPADEIAERPAHPYTRALIASLPGEGRPLVAAKGEPANPIAPPSGCPYHPRCIEAVDECSRAVPPMISLDAQGMHRAACLLLERGTDGTD